jgi:sulfite reductase (NADPH) hemoprotein beta-component
MVAKKIKDFLPEQHLLSYTTAIMRVYNLHGRRDNKYKARIKILVHETGVEEFTRQVEAEWDALRDGALKLPDADIRAIETYFAPPELPVRIEGDEAVLGWPSSIRSGFSDWLAQNVTTHKHPDYAAITISLKGIGEVRRATPATARWTRLPISPNNTPSTRSASATSRTSSCRMSRAPT